MPDLKNGFSKSQSRKQQKVLVNLFICYFLPDTKLTMKLKTSFEIY